MVQVEVQVSQRRFDVAREHLKVLERFKSVVEALFWGNVQKFARLGKKVAVVFQVQPQQAVAFQRVGAWRKDLGPNGSAVAVRKKEPVGTAVNRIGVFIACVE
jgi:hypothetical protein